MKNWLIAFGIAIAIVAFIILIVFVIPFLLIMYFGLTPSGAISIIVYVIVLFTIGVATLIEDVL